MIKSIGEILRKSREKKRLTIEAVYKATNIRPEYILALEKDNYSVFSGKVHSKGFLKIYTQFLGLNLNELLALWRREYEGGFESQAKKTDNLISKVSYPKFLITPGLVLLVFVTVATITFFGYLYFQYRSYTSNPKLELYSLNDNSVVESDILDITGKTDLDAQVYINNQKIILNPDGSFGDSVKLKEGLNTISISSINKLSKRTEVVRTVIFRPKENSVQNVPIVPESTQSTPSVQN